MKQSLALFTKLLLVFLSISILANAEELEVDNPCLKYSASKRSTRVFPDPQNPNGYLNCDSEGRAVGVLCPVGFRFSSAQSACVPKYMSSSHDQNQESEIGNRFSGFCKDGCVHGNCVFDPDERCICNPGYEGKRCDHRIDMCLREGYQQCGIRGICRNEYGTYICLCKNGKIGANCEEYSIENPCTPDALARNMSYFLVHPVFDKRYIKCMAPFTFSVYECPDGERFDSQIGRCVELGSCSLTGCQNGGQCIEMPPVMYYNNAQRTNINPEQPHFKCRCKPGFTGDLCEKKLDFCLTNPCRTGRCESGLFGAVCVCPDKLISENCESGIENPCNEANNDEVFEVISRTRAHDNAFIYCHSNGYASLVHCPQNTTFSKRSIACDTDATRRLRKELELAKGTVYIWPEIQRPNPLSQDINNAFVDTRQLFGGMAANSDLMMVGARPQNVYQSSQAGPVQPQRFVEQNGQQNIKNIVVPPTSNQNMLKPNYATYNGITNDRIDPSHPPTYLPFHSTQKVNNQEEPSQKYYSSIPHNQFINEVSPRRHYNYINQADLTSGINQAPFTRSGEYRPTDLKVHNTVVYTKPEDVPCENKSNQNTFSYKHTIDGNHYHGSSMDNQIPNARNNDALRHLVEYNSNRALPEKGIYADQNAMSRDRRSLEEWNNDPLEAVNKFKMSMGKKEPDNWHWNENIFNDKSSFSDQYNSVGNKITQPLNEIVNKISNSEDIDPEQMKSKWNTNYEYSNHGSQPNKAFDYPNYDNSFIHNNNFNKDIPPFNEFGQSQQQTFGYRNDPWQQINSFNQQPSMQTHRSMPFSNYLANQQQSLPSSNYIANQQQLPADSFFYDNNRQANFHPFQQDNTQLDGSLVNQMEIPQGHHSLTNSMQFPADSSANIPKIRNMDVNAVFNQLNQPHNDYRFLRTNGYSNNENYAYGAMPPSVTNYNQLSPVSPSNQHEYGQHPVGSYADSLLNLFNYFRSKRTPVINATNSTESPIKE
ncbi:hypothetical protein GJ496_008036 [Pomphorhynchus laevis]|nr:hypothetical protein GJ496_008036 [Pomphorhynchus laevis]